VSDFEMKISLWRMTTTKGRRFFGQRYMRMVRKDGSSHLCETEKGDVSCAEGNTTCHVECTEQPNFN